MHIWYGFKKILWQLVLKLLHSYNWVSTPPTWQGDSKTPSAFLRWVTLQKYNILSFQFFSFNLSLLISSLHGLAPTWLGEFIMLKLNFSEKVTRASTRGSEIIIIIQLLYIKQQLKRDHICEHSFYANYVLSVIFHGVRLLIYFLCIFVCTMDFYLLFMDFYVVILCISYLDYIVVHCLVVFLFF